MGTDPAQPQLTSTGDKRQLLVEVASQALTCPYLAPVCPRCGEHGLLLRHQARCPCQPGVPARPPGCSLLLWKLRQVLILTRLSRDLSLLGKLSAQAGGGGVQDPSLLVTDFVTPTFDLGGSAGVWLSGWGEANRGQAPR